MSASKIKRSSGWAHKKTTVVEMARLTRDLNGHVCTLNGCLPDASYEALRERFPQLYPPLDEIPYRADLGSALALNNLMTGLPAQKKVPIQ